MTIKRYNHERHLEVQCPEGFISCEFCDAKIKRKEELLHTKQVCFENYKKKLKAEFGNQGQQSFDLVENLKIENRQLKKLVEEKDFINNNLTAEINRLKSCNANSNANNRNSSKPNIFKNIGNNIKDNVNNLFTSNKNSCSSQTEAKKNCNKDGDCKHQ